MAKKKKDKNASKKIKQVATQNKATEPKARNYKVLFGGLFALVLTFICFSPGLHHGFVNWDDDRNIFKNELVTSINDENFWSNSVEIFKTENHIIGNYNPLAVWTFAVEKKFYGMDDADLGKWHLTNILFHLICVWLVFKIAMLLGLSWRGALFVALLFGIHPMRVESVAWLTERKDVLFGVFYLAALYLYTKGKVEHKKYTIWIALFFMLSLLSKIQAVILPISMILVDYYFDKKITVKSITTKIPYLILSVVFGVLGIYLLKDNGSIATNSNTYEAWQRIFIGSYSYVVYLVKSIVPYRMSPLYPYTPTMPWFYYASIVALPAVLFMLWKSYKAEKQVLFFGIAFFSANIFFLLQILGAGQGFLADRFTYIAYFGLFFIFGWGLDLLLEKYSAKAGLITGGVALVVGVYAFTTYNQTKIWENSDTLWSHVLKYYKKTTLPYGNRANYLRDNGEYKRAMADYSEAIRLNPKGHQAYNSRARLFFNMAKGRDTLMLALQDYNKAIELAPNDGEFYINRGATYARLGQAQKAIGDLDAGLKLKPDHATGYLNRSVMHNTLGNLELALKDINSYLQLRPYDANMWYEKARATRQIGRVREAVASYDRAIQLKPDEGLFWYERSRTKASLNDPTGAKSDLGRAIGLRYSKIDPQYRQNLGM